MLHSSRLRGFFAALLLCLFGLFCAGSFFDLAVSRALYHPGSLFGQAFACIGQLPLALCFWLPVLAFVQGKKHSLPACLFYPLPAAAGLYTVYSEADAFMRPAPALAFSFALFLAVALFCRLFLFVGADPAALRRTLTLLLLAGVLVFLAITLLKEGFSRPRMRWLSEAGFSYYLPWWRFGQATRLQFTALGVPSEEFRSFPSGHTAYAALALLLPLLAGVCPALQGKERPLFAVGAAWLFAVGLSRIVIGAHFVTDVTAGAAVSLCILAAVQYAAAKKAIL